MNAIYALQNMLIHATLNPPLRNNVTIRNSPLEIIIHSACNGYIKFPKFVRAMVSSMQM